MSREYRRVLGVFAVLAFSGALFFACSSSSSSVTAASACADLAQARCQKLQSCEPQSLLNTYGSLAACESTQANTCVTNLAAPDNANSPEHTEACAQAVPSGESCDDFQLGNVPPACQPPVGSRDAGSACAVSGQCSTAYCLVPKTAACGTCAASPGVGASCANNSCGPGLVCDSTSLICATPLEAAGACDNSSACGPGLTCVGNTDIIAGSCVPLAEAGASCSLADGGSRCDSRFGLYCNVEADRVCEPVATASATQTCGTVDGGVIDCLADSFCQKVGGPSAAVPGTCVAPAAAGGACDTVNGPICMTPSRCVLTVEGGTTGICDTTDSAACN
jgi:hypothetical protein